LADGGVLVRRGDLQTAIRLGNRMETSGRVRTRPVGVELLRKPMKRTADLVLRCSTAQPEKLIIGVEIRHGSLFPAALPHCRVRVHF
jgi:hypothetical protein